MSGPSPVPPRRENDTRRRWTIILNIFPFVFLPVAIGVAVVVAVVAPWLRGR